MESLSNYQYDPQFIREKCRIHGTFNESEILSILDVARVLPYFKQIFDAEIFIDIIDEQRGVAVVIAECLRTDSVYPNSFLGELVYRENEPAIFHSYFLKQRVSSAIAVSYDRLTGDKILSHQTCVPILCDGRAVAVISGGRGIIFETQSVGIEQRSAKSKEKFAEFLLRVYALVEEGTHNWADDGLLMFDYKGKLEYYNNVAQSLYQQMGFGDISGLDFDTLNFAPQRLEDYIVMADLRADTPTDHPYRCSEAELCIEGRYYQVYLIMENRTDGKILLRICDSTEARNEGKRAQEYLVSYQEIHHRIKNNLQTVASLLRLQMYKLQEEEAKKCLSESVNRILSMAASYEFISVKGGDSGPLLGVLKKICSNMANFHQGISSRIEFFVFGDEITLDSDRLLVVSLVATELIQNSLKHAFVGRDSGEVVVSASAVGGRCHIEIRDNGVGYDPASVNGDSLGMFVVNSYVNEKLQGTLETTSGSAGTTVALSFDL